MGGSCLPVDSGNSGDDRLFSHRIILEFLLRFFDIPRKYWHVAIEKMALTFAQAIHFLHKVCFGGPLEQVQLDMDPNGFCNTSEDDISITIKRKHQTTSKNFSGVQLSSLGDSHEHVGLQKSVNRGVLNLEEFRTHTKFV
jgi:hypothetical protein